jgi:hypothetical protein
MKCERVATKKTQPRKADKKGSTKKTQVDTKARPNMKC